MLSLVIAAKAMILSRGICSRLAVKVTNPPLKFALHLSEPHLYYSRAIFWGVYKTLAISISCGWFFTPTRMSVKKLLLVDNAKPKWLMCEHNVLLMQQEM